MSSFHDVRFPTDISYGSQGGPGYSTRIITASSGFEQRNVNWQQARHRYNVGYGVRAQSQLQILLAFFHARRGQAYGFRYKDWQDFTTQTSGGVVTAQDQVLGVGDGVKTAFQLVKHYTSGSITHTRPLTRPVDTTVLVSLADSMITTGWTVNLATGIITFAAPPASGVTVKAGCAFDVPVRFATDYLPLTLESYGTASAGEIACVEIRE